MTAIDRLPATDPRAALKLLSAALIKVHKAMLDTELEQFGAAADPYQRLSLVTGHPDFAWLKAISDLIVAIDETRSPRRLPPPGPGDVARHAGEVAALVRPGPDSLATAEAGEAAGAQARYHALVGEVTEVAVAHGVLRKVLDQLHPPAQAH